LKKNKKKGRNPLFSFFSKKAVKYFYLIAVPAMRGPAGQVTDKPARRRPVPPIGRKHQAVAGPEPIPGMTGYSAYLIKDAGL
jgi:hypothetical protein